jgi:hypothetical protein
MTKKEGPGSSGGDNKNPHLFSSVVGSSSSSKQQQQKSAAITSSSLYHPSIFRYTCTGRLSLDSRNGGNSKASSGVCHGIQSNLEHIDHWRLSTRDEAIKHFEYASAMGGDVGRIGDAAGGEQSSDQQGGSATHAQQAVYLSNVLLYSPDDIPPVGGDSSKKNDDEKDNKKKKKNKNQKDISRKNTDGSTTITPQQETWSCYGSTEVDLLVLRPQNEKEESIACVSSYCAPGMTVRDLAVSPDSNNVGTADGTRERTTTIRLGILEIVYATTVEGNDNNNGTIGKDKDKDGNRMAKPSNDQVGDDDEDKEITATTGGGSWITNYSTAPGKVIHSGKNILKHMNINGQILYQSVQEDYPKRTYEASQRITNEFSKTLYRTIGLMKKVYNWDEEDWNDDDDDKK